jgi:hypothetical protein
MLEASVISDELDSNEEHVFEDDGLEYSDAS